MELSSALIETSWVEIEVDNYNEEILYTAIDLKSCTDYEITIIAINKDGIFSLGNPILSQKTSC